MATPDGRSWLTSAQIAQRLGKALLEDERVPQGLKDRLLEHKDVALSVLQDAYIETGYADEHRISRLVEKVKDAIHAGAFGPLVVPGANGPDGLPVKTLVGEIGFLLKDAYTPEFFMLFDEDGNPLEGI